VNDLDLENEDKLKNISPYDFNNPAILSQGQIETLALIHESFAQKASSAITTYLGADIEITHDGIEQIYFQQYIDSLPPSICYAVCDMLPLNGRSLIHADSSALYPFIDKMLGGDGSPESIPPETGLTELELAVMRKFYKLLLDELRASWLSVIDLSFGFIDVQSQLSYIRVVPMREMCVVVNLKIKYGESEGKMSICMPYLYLEPIAYKFDRDCLSRQQHGHQSKEIRATHEKNFKEMLFTVTADIGQLEINVRDLLYLQVGDLLTLSQRVKDPINVYVAGVKKFTASPGLLGKYKSIIIRSEEKTEG
jgi:flagellar motor switch protein FliM